MTRKIVVNLMDEWRGERRRCVTSDLLLIEQTFRMLFVVDLKVKLVLNLAEFIKLCYQALLLTR